MRTHLLRTFYPSHAAEPDTGAAANDADYELLLPNHVLRPSVMTLAVLPKAETPSREDDYALGGYAGI